MNIGLFLKSHTFISNFSKNVNGFCSFLVCWFNSLHRFGHLNMIKICLCHDSQFWYLNWCTYFHFAICLQLHWKSRYKISFIHGKDTNKYSKDNISSEQWWSVEAILTKSNIMIEFPLWPHFSHYDIRTFTTWSSSMLVYYKETCYHQWLLQNEAYIIHALLSLIPGIHICYMETCQ